MKISLLLRLTFGLITLGLVAGCNLLPEPKPDLTRYFVLEGGVPGASAPAGAVRLGLRTVEIPAYLKTKSMVVRSGGNEIRYIDSARWAEPLDAGLTRLLRAALATRAQVVAYPFPANLERDYDVTIRVLNAEGADEGVRFTAVVVITRVGDTATQVERRVFTAPARVWRGDYAELAAGLSAAIAGLADEVLLAIPAK